MKGFKGIVVAAMLSVLVIPVGKVQAGTQEDLQALQVAVAALQTQVADLQAQLDTNDAVQIGKLGYMKLDTNELNYLKGPHVIFEGVNVHVRDGSGVTKGEWLESGGNAQTGLGNLIIGYNELSRTILGEVPTAADRTGTHNLVIGREHRYRSYGNILQGWACIMNADNSAGLACDENLFNGGSTDLLGGNYAVSLGGHLNRISEYNGVIAGGYNNTIEVDGNGSVISGGQGNIVTGYSASITGGSNNSASGVNSSISGGNSITVDTTDGWSAPGH